MHEELLAHQLVTLSYPALSAFCRKHGIGHEQAKPAGRYLEARAARQEIVGMPASRQLFEQPRDAIEIQPGEERRRRRQLARR
jgi:hypothetical protein